MASSWMPSRVKDREKLPGAALPADVVVGGGAVIGLVLGRDGEHAVLYIQIDVLLAEAGQVGLEQVVGALVPDISAEDRRAAAALAEHAALQLVKQIHHAAVAAAGVGDHIHKSKLLSVPAEHPPARASLNFGFIIVRDYEFFVTQMCHKCKY